MGSRSGLQYVCKVRPDWLQGLLQCFEREKAVENQETGDSCRTNPIQGITLFNSTEF